MLEEKGALKAEGQRSAVTACNCGGTFTEQLHDFEGIQSPALVCQTCGSVTLTLKQAEVLMKLKQLQAILQQNRKLIKIGNSIGLTLPERLQEYGIKAGDRVQIKPISERTFEISILS